MTGRKMQKTKQIAKNLLLNLAFCLLPVGVLAQGVVEVEIPVSTDAPVKHILFQGQQVRLKYIVSSPARTIRVRAASDFAKKYSASQVGVPGAAGAETRIEIRRQAANSKSDYAQSSQTPIEDIELIGPSLASLSASVVEGSIQLTSFDGKLDLSLTKGRINLKSVKGSQKIYLNKGDLLIEQSSGTLVVDSNTGNLILRDYDGAVKIDNFGAELSVERGVGDLQLKQFQGNSKITSRAGEIRIDQHKGSLVVQSPAGSVDAQLGEAASQFYLKPESENIQVKSKVGRVTVVVPDGVAVPVNLATVEGDLLVPPVIDKQRFGTGKSVRATFPGTTKSKTTVFVRSVEGSIVLR